MQVALDLRQTIANQARRQPNLLRRRRTRREREPRCDRDDRKNSRCNLSGFLADCSSRDRNIGFLVRIFLIWIFLIWSHGKPQSILTVIASAVNGTKGQIGSLRHLNASMLTRFRDLNCTQVELACPAHNKGHS